MYGTILTRSIVQMTLQVTIYTLNIVSLIVTFGDPWCTREHSDLVQLCTRSYPCAPQHAFRYSTWITPPWHVARASDRRIRQEINMVYIVTNAYSVQKVSSRFESYMTNRDMTNMFNASVDCNVASPPEFCCGYSMRTNDRHVQYDCTLQHTLIYVTVSDLC
jgi:hypothetical protein